MRVALVGCGHIGGSLALALREAGAASPSRVIGHDASDAAARRALERGIIDELAGSPEDAARSAELVILAVPVRAIVPVAARLAGTSAIVTDVGSTKAGVVRGCEAVLARFVGGHPIAGTERAGPDAADAALFRGRKVFLTPTERTERAAHDQVAALWRTAGAAHVADLDAEAHDRIFAAVSHLPHVAAYALVSAIGGVGHGGRDFVGLTGGGFQDTTRIASTPPAMWVDVFLENRDALLPLIDQLGSHVAAIRAAIVAGDGPEIARLLGEARAARERILGPS
jgi:prephenate dehydrogenase